MKRVAFYLRVSKKVGQTIENQRRDLNAAAKRHKWKVVAVFHDKLSGTRDDRAEYVRLKQAITRKEFDIVAAWSVDRLGRSAKELIGFLQELKAKGVGLYLHQQGLDTATPGGKLLFQMSSVFAESEREQIVERILSGLARAKASGKTLGRPRIPGERESAIQKALLARWPKMRIRRELNVGISTIQRVEREMAKKRQKS